MVSVTAIAGPAEAQLLSPKVAVIVMENTTYSKIVGSTHAPYLNSLISSGELFTNYYAVINGSVPNYRAMTSGLTGKPTPPPANIFQAIDGTGGAVTWMEFEEGMSGNCGAGSAGTVPGKTEPLYNRGHDPAYQFRQNTSCTQHDVPLTSATFNPASLPDFTYIVPNQCDDMHSFPKNGQPCPAYFGPNSGSDAIRMGDNWLQRVVPLLLADPTITVLITWDEGSAGSEHIVTLEVGAGVTAGSTDGTAYNHYSLEAGLYNAYGLGTAPNNGATATPLPIP